MTATEAREQLPDVVVEVQSGVFIKCATKGRNNHFASVSPLSKNSQWYSCKWEVSWNAIARAVTNCTVVKV